MTLSEIYEKAGVSRLPIDPVAVASTLGIKVVGYKAAAELFEMDIGELYSRCPLGFSFKEGEKCCIALNENSCGELRRRFTAAHELAHCVLGHLDNGDAPPLPEHDAERFAADLLAPLVVLHKCGVGSAGEIARICGISLRAASYRLDRLTERRRFGFCADPDELRTAEIFREFTENFGKRRAVPENGSIRQIRVIDKNVRYLSIKRV